MTHRFKVLVLTTSLLVNALVCSPAPAAEDAARFLAEPSWSQPRPDDIRALLSDWLTSQPISEFQRMTVLATWDGLRSDVPLSEHPLDRLLQTFAQLDPQVAEVLHDCQFDSHCSRMSEYAISSEGLLSPLVRDNLRLCVARSLVRRGLYDEALLCLDGLTCEDVVSPAILLYCRAVAHFYLVHPEQVELHARRLLERESELPVRYQYLANLMLKDVEGLEADSLDHIARRMGDIERRLTFSRAGEKVQQIENGVIESLDKLIEKLEEQARQAQCQAGASDPGGALPSTPMQDSRLAELKAPGEVDQRDIGNRSGWGDLPPKEREEALQEIGREFPSYYREIIEQYFRELGNEPSTEGPAEP